MNDGPENLLITFQCSFRMGGFSCAMKTGIKLVFTNQRCCLEKQGETPYWWSVVNKASIILRSKNKNRLQTEVSLFSHTKGLSWNTESSTLWKMREKAEKLWENIGEDYNK